MCSPDYRGPEHGSDMPMDNFQPPVTLDKAVFHTILDEIMETDTDEGICVVFVDLNNFKSVNDEFGHAKGDEVLQDIDSIIHENTRWNKDPKKSQRDEDVLGRGQLFSQSEFDQEIVMQAHPQIAKKLGITDPSVIGRIGGDEFAIILRNCNIENGQTVVERLNNAIAGYASATGLDEVGFGASTGIASTSEYDSDSEIRPTDLLKAADERMYEQKMTLLRSKVNDEDVEEILDILERLERLKIRPRELGSIALLLAQESVAR